MVLIQRDAPYPHWEFSDPGSGDLLRLVPERGGLISGWRCSGREVVYLDLERFLDPAQSVRGGFPVLFPITGGLPDNQLPLPQGTFTLGQHGFARQLPWQMEPLADGRGVLLQLSDTPETLQYYPFPFLLSMEVRLAAGLSQGIDLLVRPTGAVRMLDEAAGTTLELQLSHPFDLVVLWTEPPRPMICIEPWSGPRQALLSGDRRIELAPGASTVLNTRYALIQP